MRNARILGIGLTASCLAVGFAGYTAYMNRHERSAEAAYAHLASIDLCDYNGQVIEIEFTKTEELLVRIGRLEAGTGKSIAVATQVAEKLGRIGAVNYLKRMETSLIAAEVSSMMIEPFVRYRYLAEIRKAWPNLVTETEWTGENLASGEFLMGQLTEYLSRFPDHPHSTEILNMSLEAMNDSPQANKLYKDLSARPIPEQFKTIINGRVQTRSRVGSGVDISIVPNEGSSFRSRSHLGRWVVMVFAEGNSTNDSLHQVLQRLTSQRSDLQVAVSYSDSGGGRSALSSSWDVVYEGNENLGHEFGIVERPHVLLVDPKGILVANGLSASGLEAYFGLDGPKAAPKELEQPTHLGR